MSDERWKFGEYDPAEFEQAQARALEMLRERKCWFVYAIADDLTGEYVLAAPESAFSANLPRRLLTRALVGAALDTLEEMRDELEDE